MVHSADRRASSFEAYTLFADCPPDRVGCIIGKQGKTIKKMQSLTGTTIEVDQHRVPPRIMVISSVENAADAHITMDIVNHIINGTFHYSTTVHETFFDALEDTVERSKKTKREVAPEAAQREQEVIIPNGWTPWQARWEHDDLLRYCWEGLTLSC